ncbi:uncharacterized protein LOC127123285 [Lathyrus oleraceus]|uniref:uncharacterized protein LOC127123285 n=1 Tax=Pisum sativum TaxID=3888 RepID=UPI0021CEE244|nr:uncharacterized protein LOC127123285 [Pisum sativum]
MAHQSDTTSFTTVSDSHSTESGNPNREEVSVNAATSPRARRPKEPVSRITSAIALDNLSKEGSRYVHNAIASMVTKILSGDRNVPGVSVPLNTIVPDDVACRETAVVLRENVSGLPEEGPKNDKHVSMVRGEKVSVPQDVEANPRADTVNLDEFSDNELLASVIPSIAKRVRTRRGKKTVMQRSPSKEVDETTPHKQTGTESACKRKGHGPAKSWSKEMSSRSSAAKKRKVESTSRTVPIQFDTDKFVGAKQAARYVALEKRKILLEKRFLINAQGDYRTFAGLINSKKWDKLISPPESYDIDIVCEFYANALPNDDEPFTWTTRVSGRQVAFDRDAINRVLGEPLHLGVNERDAYHRDLRLHRNTDTIFAALLFEGKSVEVNPSGVPMRYHREDMIPLAQLILMLVLTNIKPKSHTSTVPIPVAHLVHCILTNVQIDVARIIAIEMKSVVESGLKSGAGVNCSPAFPCLIMALCLQPRVKLPSRSQVRIPSAIDDRYVDKYYKPKNFRGSTTADDTGAADGPGAFSQGFDPFQQAVCNYNWDWMAATQRAMIDIHDSMHVLQLQVRDPFGEHPMMTRE